MTDINIGQLSESINDKADRDLGNTTYTPVNKAGDTISGTLTSTQLGSGDSSVPFVVFQKYAPSYGSTTYSNIMFRDSNNGYVAIIGGIQDTSGNNSFRFLTWNKNTNAWDYHPYILTTYANGTSGYNIWSNGYCEQWGQYQISSVNTDYTVTLPKTFANINYCITSSYISTGSTGFFSVYTKSTSTILIRGNVATSMVSWKACGYLASDQY